MGEDTCYLITLLYGEELLKCALKVELDLSYPMEPKSRKVLMDLLPLHVRTLGPIVAVEKIFEIEVVAALDKEE